MHDKPSPPATPGTTEPLPEGWMMHRSRTGEAFFHHFDTGKTQWERPTAYTNPAPATASPEPGGAHAATRVKPNMHREARGSRRDGSNNNIPSSPPISVYWGVKTSPCPAGGKSGEEAEGGQGSATTGDGRGTVTGFGTPGKLGDRANTGNESRQEGGGGRRAIDNDTTEANPDLRGVGSFSALSRPRGGGEPSVSTGGGLNDDAARCRLMTPAGELGSSGPERAPKSWSNDIDNKSTGSHSNSSGRGGPEKYNGGSCDEGGGSVARRSVANEKRETRKFTVRGKTNRFLSNYLAATDAVRRGDGRKGKADCLQFESTAHPVVEDPVSTNETADVARQAYLSCRASLQAGVSPETAAASGTPSRCATIETTDATVDTRRLPGAARRGDEPKAPPSVTAGRISAAAVTGSTPNSSTRITDRRRSADSSVRQATILRLGDAMSPRGTPDASSPNGNQKTSGYGRDSSSGSRSRGKEAAAATAGTAAPSLHIHPVAATPPSTLGQTSSLTVEQHSSPVWENNGRRQNSTAQVQETSLVITSAERRERASVGSKTAISVSSKEALLTASSSSQASQQKQHITISDRHHAWVGQSVSRRRDDGTSTTAVAVAAASQPTTTQMSSRNPTRLPLPSRSREVSSPSAGEPSTGRGGGVDAKQDQEEEEEEEEQGYAISRRWSSGDTHGGLALTLPADISSRAKPAKPRALPLSVEKRTPPLHHGVSPPRSSISSPPPVVTGNTTAPSSTGTRARSSNARPLQGNKNGSELSARPASESPPGVSSLMGTTDQKGRTAMGKILAKRMGSQTKGPARPSTARPHSLSPTTCKQRREESEGITRWRRSSREVGGGGTACDGAPGYRAFVERWFSKGIGAGGVLLFNRTSTKAITELMCHTSVALRQPLLSSTPAHLADTAVEMFRAIQIYMGDATARDDEPARRGRDEVTLRGILRVGRGNVKLALELYCQLVKQTHLCGVPENEEAGFVILMCAAHLFPPPTKELAAMVLGHLALHRGRPEPSGGIALYSHNFLSTSSAAWAPTLETDPLVLLHPALRNCAKNCFVPGTVFGVTLGETLRQEYYAQGIGEVTSPAPSSAYSGERVPILVQLLVQTIDCLGGARTEGIFRLSCHAGAKEALKTSLAAGDYSTLRRLRDEGRLKKGCLPGDEAFDVDVNTVANILKAWLRSLKHSLVPTESYDRAVDAGRVNIEGGGEHAQEEALRVLLALPPLNRATLEYLARFLNKVASQEATNRMGAKALGLVFSPNLLRNPGDDPLVFQANARAEASFIQSLIEQSHQ